MNITEIVFSPTGGTQRVVDILTSEWSDSIKKIDLTNAKNDYTSIDLKNDDIAVIAVPSFGGRVPSVAAERIAEINGNQARCVIVCVYGNRAYEDTLIELSDLAEKSNLKIIAAVSAVAEHSIMHQYATGRPDHDDKKQLQEFAEKIYRKISDNAPNQNSILRIPGNRPYKKAGGAGLFPKANAKCNNCMLCAERCPVQAISKDNIKISNSKKCISCMRCVTDCPQSARTVNNAVVSIAALAIKKACSERKENELFI